MPRRGLDADSAEADFEEERQVADEVLEVKGDETAVETQETPAETPAAPPT